MIKYLKQFALTYALVLGATFLSVMWSFFIFGPVAVLYLMKIDWWQPFGAGLLIAFGWVLGGFLSKIILNQRRRARE